MLRLSKVIVGWLATSKKSGERRCSSRCGSPVIKVMTSIAALTDERFGSSAASTMVPEMPVNCPLTFDSIMCRTLNWAKLWRWSMCHTDQLCVMGVVFASATIDMWGVLVDVGGAWQGAAFGGEMVATPTTLALN